MKIFDGRVFFGFVLGFGAGLFASKLTPGSTSSVRGLLKNGIKASILASERLRELLAHVREAAEDAAAEAQAELEGAGLGSNGHGEPLGSAERPQ
jgi:hypothetical protein